MSLSRVKTRGRVTIPKKIRDRLNISAGDRVVWTVEGKKLFLKVIRMAEQGNLFKKE